MALVVACVMAAGVAEAAPRGFDGAWKTVVQDYKANLAAEGTLGSSLAVAQDGRLLGTAHFGVADKSTGRAVDADTLYHWASITKLFTEIAVMQLRDRGKLSLDDRIIDYLPETKQVHNRFGPMSAITLRHLITHSSGLRARTFPWRGESEWEPLEPAQWSQIAAMMPYSEIEFQPGSKFSYSNPGASMLGRVVEEITGEDIEIYITKNILMPLGMTRSYFDTTPYHLQPHRSHSYYLSKNGLEDLGAEVETGATKGNGGLNGPVTDMMKFANFLLGVGDNGTYGTILSRATLAEMWQPKFEARKTETFSEEMGLGFFLFRDLAEPSIRMIGHTGGQQGFSSFLYIHPESRSAIIAADNTLTDVKPSQSAFSKVRRDMITKVVTGLAKGKRISRRCQFVASPDDELISDCRERSQAILPLRSSSASSD